MKIIPVEAELFHADRQTDRITGGRTDIIRLITAFRNFLKASNMIILKSLKGIPKPKLQGCSSLEEEEGEGGEKKKEKKK
jgi:hypothetical protein